MSTAAVIIIGREILTGKFADENGPFFIRELRSLGVDLQRLAMVDDHVDAIAEEVRRCSSTADHVFTTGGVGPTHDDVTLESVAAAFGVGMVLSAPLLELMASYGIEPNAANRRMATLPEGSELVSDGPNAFPVVRCRNVWVLPGVPSLVRKKFAIIAPHLAGTPLHTGRLHLAVHETDIAEQLTALAAAHPEVEIGSYPRFDTGGPRVILTVESASEAAMHAALDALAAALPVMGPS
jgi:molybdenum cofactor synthesis domain-containing protein